MSYSNYYKNSNLFHGSAMNMMGTRLDVLMTGNEHLLSDVWIQIMAETGRLHRMLNRFDAASDISRINREAVARPVELDGEFWNILADIKKYHHRTFGYFDVTLRNFDRVILDNARRTMAFAEKDISLDLGGYAKGYALERIREIMLRAGVTQALINFGNSSVLAVGSHPHGKYWGIGIENPFVPGQQLKTCQLCNQSLSTSGNTPAHTNHIINPRSGQYTPEKKIISVISDNAVEAEVLSTALMVADEKTILSVKKIFGNIKIDIFMA
jgi:thiamine biosynthesis lipoprotein